MPTDDYARKQARNYFSQTPHEFKEGFIEAGYPSNHCCLCSRHKNSSLHDVEYPQRMLPGTKRTFKYLYPDSPAEIGITEN